MEEVPGFSAPVRRALTEPILLGGAPRSVAILNGTLAAALGLDPRVRALVEQEAARSGSRYTDASVLFSSKDEYAFADGIHPDRDGHRRVAELLAGPLTEMLSRSSKGEGPY